MNTLAALTVINGLKKYNKVLILTLKRRLPGASSQTSPLTAEVPSSPLDHVMWVS